jgi:hypothetical protein
MLLATSKLKPGWRAYLTQLPFDFNTFLKTDSLVSSPSICPLKLG